MLPVIDESGVRPTSERTRETLFNWLAPIIDGAACLDLFAGTGALGFEALSRGARTVVFVEDAKRAQQAIRDNIDALTATGATLVAGDALRYLQRGQPLRFDIVFLDPPFAADYYDELCKLLNVREWLADGALVYLECQHDRALPDMPVGWTVLKERTAGKVRYALLKVQHSKGDSGESQ